jgi:ubiquinone/menaquinone biosynthesis C-methylase UbiE
MEVHRILKPGGILYLQDTNNALSIPARRTRGAIWERAEEGDGVILPLAGTGTPFKELRRRFIQ